MQCQKSSSATGLVAFLSASTLLLGAGQASAEAGRFPIRLDCLAQSAACPELTIEGDPWAEIAGAPSPFRGYGDPSIRKDPRSDRLWMTYSYLDVHLIPTPTFGVSIHLAKSRDQGRTWKYVRELARSSPEIDPGPRPAPGVSVQEVSTLAPLDKGLETRWFGMHFRYFQPFGPEGRRPPSFHFRLSRAGRPAGLIERRQARLGGPLTDPAWRVDLDLSSLDEEVSDCLVWTEPALFGHDGTLYLVAQCLVIDPRTGRRRPRKEFLGVFTTNGEGPLRRLDWRWHGRLAGRAEARALGGDVLTQPDLALARDGSLLLLVTPKRLAPIERHRGCRVLEVESLDTLALARRDDGELLIRADIRSSDSTGLGPGLCAYDAASETGVLFVRTEIDLERPDIVFRLHATGVHP